MALTGSLGTFHHPGVSRIDYKPLDMDRVLTALLARLWHHGMPSKISRTATLDVDVFVKLFLDHPEVFDGFDRETTTRWTVTHLMDMVNRGRADEAVAAPRPLHGFTYRFRNSRKSRPYGADEQLYEMLSEDEGALKGLREFFFSDVRPGHRYHHPRPGHRRRDSGVAAPGGARGPESTGPGGHEQAPRPLSAAVRRARTAALSGCHAAPLPPRPHAAHRAG